jgi:hypothetical protein
MEDKDSLRIENYSISLIDRREVTILIPPECKVPLPDGFGPATLDQLEEVLLYPPVLKQLGRKTYELVSRHWLTTFIVDNRIDVFPAIVLSKKQDESVFKDVRIKELSWLGITTTEGLKSGVGEKIDPAVPRKVITETSGHVEPATVAPQNQATDVEIISGAQSESGPAETESPPPAGVVTGPSATTVLGATSTHPQDISPEEELWPPSKSRKRSRDTERICPFCGGPLVYRSKEVPLDADFSRTVACDYRWSPKIRCKFSLDITEWEDKKFRAFDFRTTDFVKIAMDKTCKCKETMYLRIIHTSDTEKREEYYCRTRMVELAGRYSSDDFKTLEAIHRNLSVKQLCDAIFKAKLDIVYPDKKHGLPWLNSLLANPKLREAMDRRGLTSFIRGGKGLADFVTELLKEKRKVYSKHEIEKIMLFNRIRIERTFSVSPRLFQDGFDFCKRTEP